MDDQVWLALSCDEQFALASRIAGNVGYNLTPEHEEIDATPRKPLDPELQACIDAASKAFRETFASLASPEAAAIQRAETAEAECEAFRGKLAEVCGKLMVAEAALATPQRTGQ